MNTTFKMARTSLNHSWRFVSNKAKGQFSSLRRLPAVTSQNRRYADRYTFDDQTQAQIQGIKKMKEMSAVPRESPWRDSEWSPDFPERLDELGYESHCNDRLYIAKNKIRHEQQKYELEREERRKQAQRRINSHFAKGQAEPDLLRRRTISQDPADHQRRQEAIIEQNRRRWQNRPESRRKLIPPALPIVRLSERNRILRRVCKGIGGLPAPKTQYRELRGSSRQPDSGIRFQSSHCRVVEEAPGGERGGALAFVAHMPMLPGVGDHRGGEATSEAQEGGWHSASISKGLSTTRLPSDIPTCVCTESQDYSDDTKAATIWHR